MVSGPVIAAETSAWVITFVVNEVLFSLGWSKPDIRTTVAVGTTVLLSGADGSIRSRNETVAACPGRSAGWSTSITGPVMPGVTVGVIEKVLLPIETNGALAGILNVTVIWAAGRSPVLETDNT